MRATVWSGRNTVQVENVPDPKILNDRDAIVKITTTAICGSDLHLYDGYIPAMEKGDILGHEFMGEVVDKVRGAMPRAKAMDELRRFKQRVETGVIVRSDGVPEGELAERKLDQPTRRGGSSPAVRDRVDPEHLTDLDQLLGLPQRRPHLLPRVLAGQPGHHGLLRLDRPQPRP